MSEELEEPCVVVRGEGELHTLYRALYSAKFADPPWYEELPGSPFLADMILQVFDKTQSLLEARIKQAPSLGQDALLRELRAGGLMHSERPEWGVIVKNALRAEKWNEWNEEQRRDYLRLLAAPFELSEAVTTELLLAVATTAE